MAAYRIYSQITPILNACSYYRVMKPLVMMDQMGLPIEAMIDNSDSTIPMAHRVSAFMEADITLCYQPVGKMSLDMIKEVAKYKPMRDHEGAWRWPPTFIMDSDDDLFNVHPLNITFGLNGIKRPDGTLMQEGDEIGIGHPLDIPDDDMQSKLNMKQRNPSPNHIVSLADRKFIYCSDGLWHNYIKLWKDGENMSLSDNLARMDNWREYIKVSQLMTCSTPRVASYIKREVPSANTFISPNAIDMNEYLPVELRDHPGEVRILWQGSATHHEDLWPLNNAIGEMAKKYPQTRWIFFGAPYKWAIKNIPPEQLRLVPWTAYEAFKLTLSTIGHDINLCPLAPHIFNQSRSAIKWYESSAISRPAATLAQRTGAYEDEIEEGKTGLLFGNPEEFKTKLSELIESEKLRNELAANSKDWVRTNRDARKIYQTLFNKWMEVREAHKLTKPIEEVDKWSGSTSDRTEKVAEPTIKC